MVLCSAVLIEHWLVTNERTAHRVTAIYCASVLSRGKDLSAVGDKSIATPLWFTVAMGPVFCATLYILIYNNYEASL